MLITQERIKKFDLLLHLIFNLTQPIALCGPEGIGKTTILNRLKADNPSAWNMCYLRSSPDLRVDEIRRALWEALREAGATGMEAFSDASLDRTFERLAQQQKLVLLLDDAGRLAPGVITELYQLAISIPALRLVVAITPDDLHVISASDPAIEDYHFVEVPPLTEAQCGEFIKSLAGRSNVSVALNAVTPPFVHRIYSETHGIPGRILRILPEVSKTLRRPKLTSAAAYVGVALVVATGVGISMFWKDAAQLAEEKRREIDLLQSSRNEGLPLSAIDQAPRNEENGAEPTSSGWASSLPEVAEQAAPAPDVPADEASSAATEPFADDTVTDAPNAGPSGEAESVVLEAELDTGPIHGGVRAAGAGEPTDGVPPNASAVVEEAARSAAEPVSEDRAESTFKSPDQPEMQPVEPADPMPAAADPSGLKGADWLLGQNPAHYTLQIMAVSRLEGLKKIALKHPQLHDLAFFRTSRGGKELYPLVYGVYPTQKAANAAKKDLPASLSDGWVRQLKHIQKEIRSHRQ